MKTQSNSNLTVREALERVVSDIATRVVNGDLVSPTSSTPIKQSKPSIGGKCTKITGNIITVLQDDNQEITINSQDNYNSIIPSIGATVVVGYEGDGTPFIQTAGIVDTWSIETVTNLNLFGENILLGTSPEANVAVYYLLDTTKLVEKINAIVNSLNSLKSTFNSHVHTSSAPTTPTSPLITPFTGTFNEVDEEAVSNKNITIVK